MSFEIIATPTFKKSLKALAKRHVSLKKDFQAFIKDLSENPLIGVEISPKVRKIRMAISSKGRGKSGGARIITYTTVIDEESGIIYLIDIYDKSDFSTVDLNIIKSIVDDLS